MPIFSSGNYEVQNSKVKCMEATLDAKDLLQTQPFALVNFVKQTMAGLSQLGDLYGCNHARCVRQVYVLAYGILGICISVCAIVSGYAQTPPEWNVVMQPNERGKTARPLRYWPVGTEFVITNGGEFFNRPLYCANSPFRVDGGDMPEFSIYLPGRGGNLRLGFKTYADAKWLHEATSVVSRYRPGALQYQITDPALGKAEIDVTAQPIKGVRGFIVKAELVGESQGQIEFIWAFGGANGMRGRRGGDIGCEREPVSKFFQLKPEQCRGNRFSISTNIFVLHSRVATLAGVASSGTTFAIADANRWTNLNELLATASFGHTYHRIRTQTAPHNDSGETVLGAVTTLQTNQDRITPKLTSPITPALSECTETSAGIRTIRTEMLAANSTAVFVTDTAHCTSQKYVQAQDREHLFGAECSHAAAASVYSPKTVATVLTQQLNNLYGDSAVAKATFNGDLHADHSNVALNASGRMVLTAFGMASNQVWELPIVLGVTMLRQGCPVYLVVQHIGSGEITNNAVQVRCYSTEELSQLFYEAENYRAEIAGKIVVNTPDPFINAAAAALSVAADAIWDEQEGVYMHGAVAWRSKLLGWRGPYAGDALGWHDRARRHLTYWAGQQLTNPPPDKLPPPDAESNFARSEAALHSYGALSTRHYDMNLIYIDTLFRHLLWTGDIEYARSVWPVVERHFGWEQRLFRRPFGGGNLPLYEAYAAIWASDDIQYNGGGVAYTSAYNYWHNKMAGRVARLIGKDPTPFEREAELIWNAMHELLWLKDRGWYAEFKDWLGLQLVHPSCGVWTVYHTIDSEAGTPLEAWLMTRYLDTQLPHIPIHGPNVPDEGLFTLPTTTWMPYTWSVNNVVMAEALHTALAYWQANRPDPAYRLFKGALLDSMFMGLCPGNLGMTTPLDVARREAQRDFADAVGVCARAFVEGLFGVKPDALAGELFVQPGLPLAWQYAQIKHTDFELNYSRGELGDIYVITQSFPKPMRLRLHAPAMRNRIRRVIVNGKSVQWRPVETAIGLPRIEITAPAASTYVVGIEWGGIQLHLQSVELNDRKPGDLLQFKLSNSRLTEIFDPQGALAEITKTRYGFSAKAGVVPGHKTVFAKINTGQLTWLLPATFEVRGKQTCSWLCEIDWHNPLPYSARFEPVDLTQFFNDTVTQIFRNEYLSPRSPFCSLAIPKQGIGGWATCKQQFEVDDSGLRAVAATNNGKVELPNGVFFLIPTNSGAKNVIFVSQWDNYPSEVTVPLHGRARRAFFLMAGSTNPMQSQLDNGEVIVTYADGSTARLPLHNPSTWWPIDQDYFIDDYAFRRPEPIPPRIDLKTGKVRILDVNTFKGKGGKVPGGAATVLDLILDPTKELRGVTIRALANEVVIGLMAVTLQTE